jgi:PAS domain S-box-containing protein
MAAGEFAYSFALFDANQQLVDWDEGFEKEWVYAAPKLRRGITYREMVRAALSDPATEEFITLNYPGQDQEELIAERTAGFGSNRTWEYTIFGNRTVRVDERCTRLGGVRRFARDITEERQAESALAEAQQRLEAADSGPGVAFTETRRNPDGSYVFEPISEALARLMHFPAEAVGQDPMFFYARMITTPEENAARGAAMERAAERLEICSYDYPVRDGNEQVMWIRQSMLPRREHDGTIIFAGVMRDVTREKEAEDEVEMLRSVVVRSTDSIAVFESQPEPDSRSKVVYVNQKFTELFGYTSEEVLGKPIEILRPSAADTSAGRKMMAALQRNDGSPILFEAHDKQGRAFWVEMRISTIQRFENGGFRWTIIGRDVTERRNTEMELLRAKEAAEAGNKAKSQFLANMSHELRTPLNAIIGFTELIEHGVERTGWTPAYSEYLADVSESGRHLLDLINTILDLSKIEAGSLQLSIAPTDVCELVNASVTLVSSLATTNNVSLNTKLPEGCPDIQGDFMKLKQVLLNILSNAIKFTPSGGRISTEARFTAKHAVITVTDTGVGIAAEDLERVTQPFFQVETALSRKFAGSGLGLAIARELVNLHKGKLEIESTEGKGTTVRVFLPR